MKLRFIALFCCMALTGLAAETPKRFFPYDWQSDVLPNGLRVVTVPTEDPQLVALYIVARTGSRNEVEKGKSGYAHLFEHMIITKDAEALRNALIQGPPSPLTYNSPKPQEVLDEDKIIERYPLPVKAERIRIIPVDDVFK